MTDLSGLNSQLVYFTDKTYFDKTAIKNFF